MNLGDQIECERKEDIVSVYKANISPVEGSVMFSNIFECLIFESQFGCPNLVEFTMNVTFNNRTPTSITSPVSRKTSRPRMARLATGI